jgi:large conductance mechanosensitive channel protein
MTETKPASETHVMQTKDDTVKITQPTGRKHKGITVILDSDDVIREQAGGFVNFLREHAVVGLAVGFIIGQQAQAVVKQMVDSFVTPLLSVWIGENLMEKQFMIGHAAFTWGKLVYTLINFLFVIFFIYVIIKLFNLDKLDKPKS